MHIFEYTRFVRMKVGPKTNNKEGKFSILMKGKAVP